MKKRRNYTIRFKTKVLLEALQERESIQEIGKKYEVHPIHLIVFQRVFSGHFRLVV
jgi:transposase